MMRVIWIVLAALTLLVVAGGAFVVERPQEAAKVRERFEAAFPGVLPPAEKPVVKSEQTGQDAGSRQEAPKAQTAPNAAAPVAGEAVSPAAPSADKAAEAPAPKAQGKAAKPKKKPAHAKPE